MERALIVLGLCILLSGGFLGFQVNRIADSLEYGETQARKFEPLVNRAEQQLNIILRGGL